MKDKPDLIKIYFFYFILYLIIVITNNLCINYVNGIVALVTGCVWTVPSIVFYLFYLRKKGNTCAVLIYAIFNAIIGGITASAYYRIKDVVPYKAQILVLIFAGLMLLNFCLYLLIKSKVVFSVINLIIAIISLCAAGYIWYDIDKSVGSSLFFMLIVYLCFSVAQLLVARYCKSWINLLSLSTLFMFGGILLVVLAIISEGDALDLLQIVPDAADGTKAKKNR